MLGRSCECTDHCDEDVDTNEQHQDGEVEGDRTDPQWWYDPAQCLQRRVSDRVDDLKEHQHETGRTKISGKRLQQLDDHASDQRQ